MRFDFTAPIKSYEDEAIKVSNAVEVDEAKGIEAKEAEYMTLGSMAIQALNLVTEAEKDLAASKKVHRATLSMMIHGALKGENNGFVDVELEDVIVMKDQMNKIYAPLPLMRAFELFDPKVEEVAENK